MADLYVLGLSGLHDGLIGHSTAAALLKNGRLVAAASEERYVRVKDGPHYFPVNAVNACLSKAGIGIKDIALAAFNTDPRIQNERWAGMGRARWAKRGLLRASRISKKLSKGKSWIRVHDPEAIMGHWEAGFRHHFGHAPPIRFVEHHLAHAASTYYTSGVDKATIIVWDGGGNMLSTLVLKGEDNAMSPLWSAYTKDFSLGSLYGAITNYLGLSEPGALMGLASFAKPANQLHSLVDFERFRMDFKTILRPHIGYRPELERILGPHRFPKEPMLERHKQLAADAQDITERFGLKIAKNGLQATGHPTLCLSGGVGLNSVLNGKLARDGAFKEVWIQPASGDEGGALGAAFMAHKHLGQAVPLERMAHAYWGTEYTDEQVEQTLQRLKLSYRALADDEEVAEVVSGLLADGKIVAWSRLGAEWGPRSLGARSILGNPTLPDMADRINNRVKFREPWRPFAPVMPEEVVSEYVDDAFYSPFMLFTFRVKPEARKKLPAITHVDGTARVQSLRRSVNPGLYRLCERFGERTGVPVILNTSFNIKGEPLVESPVDCVRCFYGSGMDAMVINRFLLQK